MLSADAERQLTDARELLASLRDSLIRFGASASDEATLARSIRQLDDFFLLVVVGEFNAGKSAFINALIGQSVLLEGVTPTTDRIHLLAHGLSPTRHLGADGVEMITAPVDVLKDALYSGEWWAPFRTAELRRAIATALREIGTPEAKRVLEDASHSGPRGVRAAIRAVQS